MLLIMCSKNHGDICMLSPIIMIAFSAPSTQFQLDRGWTQDCGCNNLCAACIKLSYYNHQQTNGKLKALYVIR